MLCVKRFYNSFCFLPSSPHPIEPWPHRYDVVTTCYDIIPEEEQKKYPIPNGDGKLYAQKYDTDNQKIYDEFLHALSELNDRVKSES